MHAVVIVVTLLVAVLLGVALWKAMSIEQQSEISVVRIGSASTTSGPPPRGNRGAIVGRHRRRMAPSTPSRGSPRYFIVHWSHGQLWREMGMGGGDWAGDI